LPLIVVVFLVKYADGLVFTCTGDSNDRSATEDLRAPAARGGSCAEGSGSAWTRCARTLCPRILALIGPGRSVLVIGAVRWVLRRTWGCERTSCGGLARASIDSGSQTAGHGRRIQGAIGESSGPAGATDSRSDETAGIQTRIQAAGWNSSCQPRSERHLHIAHVENLEVFSGDGIFVAFAQEAELVGVFQLLDAGWITAEFLDKMFHRPRVLDSAMNQFFFAVAFYLEGDDWSHDHGGDGKEGDEEYESDQNVSALGAAGNGFSSGQHHLRSVIEKFRN